MGARYADRIRFGSVEPWVGHGADGARRSAAIARDELGTLAMSDPRYDDLEAQALAWDLRAADLEAERPVA